MQASVIQQGTGSQRRVLYISFETSIPGLLCNAAVVAKGVRIVSEGRTIWTNPAGQELLFGPSLGAVAGSKTIYQFPVDEQVLVTAGNASISADFSFFTSRIGQGQNPGGLPECQEQVPGVLTVDLPIP